MSMSKKTILQYKLFFIIMLYKFLFTIKQVHCNLEAILQYHSNSGISVMLILLFARSLPSTLLQSDPVQHLTQESSLGLHFVLQLFVFTHFLVILVSLLYTRVSQDWNDVFKYMNIFNSNVLIIVVKVFSSILTLYDAF